MATFCRHACRSSQDSVGMSHAVDTSVDGTMSGEGETTIAGESTALMLDNESERTSDAVQPKRFVLKMKEDEKRGGVAKVAAGGETCDGRTIAFDEVLFILLFSIGRT